MSDDKYPSPETMKRLWSMDYERLVMAPGEPEVGYTEARFVLQAKVALEARDLSRATVALAVATVVLAAVTTFSILVR